MQNAETSRFPFCPEMRCLLAYLPDAKRLGSVTPFLRSSFCLLHLPVPSRHSLSYSAKFFWLQRNKSSTRVATHGKEISEGGPQGALTNPDVIA